VAHVIERMLNYVGKTPIIQTKKKTGLFYVMIVKKQPTPIGRVCGESIIAGAYNEKNLDPIDY